MSKTIRLLDTSIPSNKQLVIGLTYIFGIGLGRANKIIEQLGWNKKKKIIELTPLERLELIKKIDEKKKQESWLLEKELRRSIEKNINKQVTIGCYKGLRHTMNLPVRGQRTHSNAKTQKALRRYGSLFGKKK